MKEAVRTLFILVAISLLSLHAASCTKIDVEKGTIPSSNPTAAAAMLSDIDTANSISSDDLPFWVDSVFDNWTPNIYLVAWLSNAPENTMLTTQWILVKDSEGKLINQVLFNDSFQVSGTKNIAFGHQAPPAGWQDGDYVISLQLNGKRAALKPFSVQSGFRIADMSQGMQLFFPQDKVTVSAVQPIQFRWARWDEPTKYQIELARDYDFKQIVVSEMTATSAYEYSGPFNYGTYYFWRVKALEVNGVVFPADWSAIHSFQTERAPQPEKTVPIPTEPITPLWTWVAITLGTILVIVLLTLVFKIKR